MKSVSFTCVLSEEFYRHYNENDYPEILRKIDRPYNCCMIPTENGYTICIPYRSNMRHNIGYCFRYSRRSRTSMSGLDFTKLVIINNYSYIDNSSECIDYDEYGETRRNIETITYKCLKYVDVYINHKKGLKVLDDKEYNRKYKFSTLPYFEDILLMGKE